MEDKDTLMSALRVNLDQYLTRITPFGFSGAVLTAKDENIFLKKGYGLAIKDRKIANTEKTVFGIGSVTKQFTAAAVLKLEMDGKVTTEDVIGEYMDTPKDKSQITIHHILTHTAGLINYSGEDYDIAYRDETLKKILGSPLLFNPGENFKYSNAGYTLLAAIIEGVSGLPYEEYVHRNLFNPAGMEFTGYTLPDWGNRVVAHWYTDKDNQNALKKFYPYWNIMGNGEMLSTVEDLYKWYVSLKHHTILSEEMTEKLFTPFLNDYAYGWEVRETERGKTIRHGGANDLGSSAEVTWLYDEDVVLILLCNQWYGGTALTPVVKDKVEGIMCGEQYVVPPEVTTLDADTLEKYKGHYNLSSGGILSISAGPNELHLHAKGQKALTLLCSLENTEEYERLNAYSHQIFAAALTGDYEPFAKVVPDKKRVQRFHLFIEEDLGQIKKCEVVGTRPFSGKKGTVETLVQITTEEESITFGLLWEHDQIRGMRIAEQLAMYVNPLSEPAFVGYHLGMAHLVEIEFKRNQNSITGLTIRNTDGLIVNGTKIR